MKDLLFRSFRVPRIVVKVLVGAVLVGLIYLGAISAWKLLTEKSEAIFTQFVAAKVFTPVYAKTLTIITHNEINPKEIDKIVDKIHILESSGGKNDGCKRKGLVNGYGYRQNSNEVKCFDSKTDVRRLVIGWFYDRYQEKYTLSHAVCKYNTGRDVENCSYFQNYMKLN